MHYAKQGLNQVGWGSVLIETVSIIDRLISWLNGLVSFILKESTRLFVIYIKLIFCFIGQMSLMDSCSEKEIQVRNFAFKIWISVLWYIIN